MRKNTVIGVDLAKSSFQIHEASTTGKMLGSKKLSRAKFLEYLANSPKSTIYMEACGTANFWARKARSFGHEVHLIAPQYVKPFVKRHKTDAADAAAIVEAGTRAHMNFVPIKTVAQQDIQTILRIRQRHVEAKTQIMNQVRGLLGEYGIAILKGHSALKTALDSLLKEDTAKNQPHDLSPVMREELRLFQEEINAVDQRVKEYDKKVEALNAGDERSKRIMSLPGIGPVTAASIVSSIGNANDFQNARQLAAWVGLTPRQHSTGGKQRILGISKAGNQDLRTLLIHGGRAVLMNAGKKHDKRSKWAVALKDRVGMNKAAVAMAHKNIRTVYALLKNGSEYDENFKSKVSARKRAG
jgi:transposase